MELIEAVQKIKTGKARGHDEITAYMVNEVRK